MNNISEYLYPKLVTQPTSKFPIFMVKYFFLKNLISKAISDECTIKNAQNI